MKTASLLAAAIVTFASFPLVAQQVDANGQQGASASAANVNAGESTDTAAANGSHGAKPWAYQAAYENGDIRSVRGVLEGKLDSRSARSGEGVIIRTTREITTADGTDIPKGSRLMGHLTQVQAHEKGHADSQMGIVFDQAVLKGGSSVPIHAMIESVWPSSASGTTNMSAGSMGSDDDVAGGIGGGGVAGGMGGGGVASAGPAMGGGTAMGGRGLGGVGRNGGGPVGGPVGDATSTAGQTASGIDNTAGGSIGSMGPVDPAGGIYGPGSLATHSTGIPGVMLSGDATGAISGMLSATGKNVHLDSGTQMVLGIVAVTQ